MDVDVGQRRDAGAFVASGARDHVDQLVACTHLRHGDAGQHRIEESREFLRTDAECACAILIDVDTDHLAHLVPVEVHFLEVRIGAHHAGHCRGELLQLTEVFAGNPKDDRKTHRRTVFEAQHARAQAAPFAAGIGKAFFEASLEILARREVVGGDDQLREIVVEQLLVEWQVEARAAISEITREVLDRALHLRLGKDRFDLPARRFGCFQGSAVRQPQVDQQLGTTRCWKELFLHTQSQSCQCCRESDQRGGDHQPAMPQRPFDGRAHTTIERRLVRLFLVLLRLVVQFFGVQQQVAQVGGEQHRHNPGNQQRDAHHREDRKGVFTGTGPGETNRHEADGGNQGAGEHRKSGRGIGEGGRAEAIPALFHFHDHHFDGNDRVVDQQAKRDDQRAERNPLQVDPEYGHQQEGDRQHQRDRQGDDGAGAQAEAEEGNRQDDQDGFGQRGHEEVHRLADDLRLVGDDVHVDSQRQLLLQALGFGTQTVAELDHVASLVHGDGDADRFLPLNAHAWCRGIGKTTFNRRDIAEAEQAPVGLDADLANALLRLEIARDANAHAVGRRFVEPGGSHRVLLL
ncbi:MAG: hypothetical protein AW09_004149 [Candidatus Accumulibacter phosphatis]|uniref:Uncharacterized protein n=1 Tax=Candidatus Accumulibacter phosphatis TaxID=327160 RepID=A0A080LT30_9PROT|nr:MAG: hypothetical protein AW09_004149 [Candidatus Accumulibacter phosphatis]